MQWSKCVLWVLRNDLHRGQKMCRCFSCISPICNLQDRSLFQRVFFFLGMFETPLSLVPYSCNLGSCDVLRTWHLWVASLIITTADLKTKIFHQASFSDFLVACKWITCLWLIPCFGRQGVSSKGFVRQPLPEHSQAVHRGILQAVCSAALPDQGESVKDVDLPQASWS